MSIEPIRRSSRRGAKKRVYAVGDLVEIHDVSIVFCHRRTSNHMVVLGGRRTMARAVCRANPDESTKRNRRMCIWNSQRVSTSSHISVPFDVTRMHVLLIPKTF